MAISHPLKKMHAAQRSPLFRGFFCFLFTYYFFSPLDSPRNGVVSLVYLHSIPYGNPETVSCFKEKQTLKLLE